MPLNYVTLTVDLFDGQGNIPFQGSASFTPTVTLTDSTNHELIVPAPIVAVFKGTAPTVSLLATDNTGPLPAGWAWTVTFSNVSGNPASFNFFLPFSGGASQRLSSLSPVSSVTTMQAYMPLPTGTASAGLVPVATGTGEASAWGFLPGTVTTTQFLAQTGPKLFAHRGLAQVAPENTVVAYRAAVEAMRSAGYIPAVKTDVYQLADGSFGVMHDATVDRTTTSSGNVVRYTSQTWRTLIAKTSLMGPGWNSDGFGMPLLSDLFLELGGTCVIAIECKTSGTAAFQKLVNMIVARGLQSSVILTAEDTTLLLPPIASAAGIPFWYYWNVNPITSPVTPAQALATTGVKALGVTVNQGNSYLDSDITTVVTAAHNAGLPVNGFTYVRRYDYARAVSLGIDVHVTNDLYVATTAAMTTTDLFSIGAPVPGEVGNSTPSGQSATAPSYGYLGTAGNYRRSMDPTMGLGGVYECLGFMCPKAGFTTNSIYTVGGTMFWDVAETSTTTGAQWGAIEVGAPDDRVYTSNNGPAYTCAIRQGNGSTFAVPTLQVFKQVPGAYQNNGSYASGSGTQVGSNKSSTTGFAGSNTLASTYPVGTPVTSLTLGSAVTIPAGMKIAMPNGQIANVSSAVAASVTVPITSLTPSAAWSSGAAVSFGIPFTVKVDYSTGGQVTITFTRTDTGDQLVATDTNTAGVGPYVGGYVHIGKAGTGSAGSTLALSFAQLTIT